MGTKLPETCREFEINMLRSSLHLFGLVWKRLYRDVLSTKHKNPLFYTFFEIYLLPYFKRVKGKHTTTKNGKIYSGKVTAIIWLIF